MSELNHAHWEDLAAVHGIGPDRYYDLDALVAGGTLMGTEEVAALDRATDGQGVGGLDVMHLQCHIGCDAITMARAGAEVTGVDFSATALGRLRDLADRCGVEIATVEADSRALPRDLDGRFDLVYATIGVLCWIDDLDAWMSGVARVLRPGGRLVLVELHPLATMIDSKDPLVVDFPYTFDGGHVFSGTGSYANRDADVAWTTTQFGHGLAEVVMAALGAGLSLDYLEEHLSMSFDPFGSEEIGAVGTDGLYRILIGAGTEEDGVRGEPCPMPVLFTLLATRP